MKNRIILLSLIVLLAAALSGCIGMDVEDVSVSISLDEVPEWSGEPFVEIDGNVPSFSSEEIEEAQDFVKETGRGQEEFSKLDTRGRCGAAVASVGREMMPDGERGSIGMVRPSGWQLDKYDFIDNGGYLYNRCHLIGWQLTGQNEEERNLITGTRYMNTSGMLPFENEVADYVRTTGNHVLYRATPVFSGKELVARGVQIEALSLEDSGKGLSFNVYCYNVQPGVTIDYKTGKNELNESTLPEGYETGGKASEDGSSGVGSDEGGDKAEAVQDDEPQPVDVPEGVTYILNKNTMRFHRADCQGAQTIKEHNREWFYGTREEAIEAGYVPCGMCNP